MQIVSVNEVRDFFATASDEEIFDFLGNGLEDLICELEEDDFFGTEGFQKRFA